MTTKSTAAKKVIPLEAVPDVETRIVTRDGKPYLVVNDAMYTFYQRSMGEFTPFFLALRDDFKILGCRCTKCGIVRVPPFLTRCPDCDFAPTEPVEVGDIGTMLSTPPITYFATSLFEQQVPFGRGRLVLEGADTALSVNFYTTRGILVPGVVIKGTEMKIVFRDDRVGDITDIFCVPTSELTAEQKAKKGLRYSDLDWEHAKEPASLGGKADTPAQFAKMVASLKNIVAEMNKSERARSDIANWRRIIHYKTPAGGLTMEIHDGNLKLDEGLIGQPDFVMFSDTAKVLLDAMSHQGSLTQSIMRKELWISKNPEFTTIFKLERMARSLVRSKKAK